jgi:hypothetical protein
MPAGCRNDKSQREKEIHLERERIESRERGKRTIFVVSANFVV